MKSTPEKKITTEKSLTENLNEDLYEAWEKLKKYSLSLGPQRVYASGKSIMFSKKHCFFFVRPKKSFLEVVVFLSDKNNIKGFKSVQSVSKSKYSHTFKLIHSDQVEGDLVNAVQRAYQMLDF